jgi:hypothetical protein
MALLIGYTLAFLGAGWFCMRIPRVEMAVRSSPSARSCR